MRKLKADIRDLLPAPLRQALGKARRGIVPEIRTRVLRQRLKMAFLATPRERRLALKLDHYGRHMAYLAAGMRQLGLAAQAIDSPFLEREALAFNADLRVPLLQTPAGGKLRADILITDDPAFARSSGARKAFLFDHHFFNANRPGIRMPYFMAPGAYQAGFHLSPPPVETTRPVRIGFFGTHNPDYYTRHFRFPILPRTPILERFLASFSADIRHISGPPGDWGRVPIAVSLDSSGGDIVRKVYLSREDYFFGLEACDFLLCPPGWCMPFSHNIVESMSRGTIPILNYADYLDPHLENGKNCVTFSTLDEMEEAVRRILSLPQGKVREMRRAALDYYQTVFAPGAWLGQLLRRDEPETTVLVNNEAHSMCLRDPDFAEAAHSFIYF